MTAYLFGSFERDYRVIVVAETEDLAISRLTAYVQQQKAAEVLRAAWYTAYLAAIEAEAPLTSDPLSGPARHLASKRLWVEMGPPPEGASGPTRMIEEPPEVIDDLFVIEPPFE